MTELSRDELIAQNRKLHDTLLDAKSVIQKQQEEIDGLNSPPNAVGIFRAWYSAGTTAVVSINGRDSRVTVSPKVPSLRPGERVLLNENTVVIDTDGYGGTGTTAHVLKTLDDERVLVATEMATEMVLDRAEGVVDVLLEEGATVLVDTASRLVLELLEAAEDTDRLWLEEVPDVTYDDIGGMDEQLDKIHDAIELPYLHPELYRSMKLSPPKGVLLYGAPGCGKTMIAKAVAHQLARGKEGAKPRFIAVNGPELLSKWVGETERQIREIFARARKLATDGDPVIIFFDEMESLFRTRGSGISSDTESTLVPQLLAEMDGIVELRNVIIIGASNRQDLIDPAILRPGRLDVKVQVARPTRDDAESIFAKYLTDDLPYETVVDPAGKAISLLIADAADELYAKGKENEFLAVTYANGTKETLHFGDFSSGAMIAAIVARAKTYAIKDHLDGKPLGLHLDHLRAAIREEFRENQDLPNTTSPEDWARISGFKGEQIVRVRQIFRDAETKGVEDVPGNSMYL